MGKNFSISKLNAFLKYCFGKTSVKTETVAADNVIPFVRKTPELSPQKVSSEQVVAYSRRYNKPALLQKKTEGLPKEEFAKEKKELQKAADKLHAQAEAHDRTKFFEVSAEALKELNHNFKEKKNKVQKIILDNANLISEEFLQTVRKIKTPEELAFVIRMYPNKASLNLDAKNSEVLKKLLTTKVILLKTQQEIFRDEVKICNTSVDLIKAVTEPSKDSKVIAIEDYLKSRYGMDYVHLDNIEDANRILRTIMLAKKHNIPLPKNIIISPYTMVCSSGTNYAHSAQDFTVVLKSAKEEKTIRENALSKLTAPEFKDEITRLRNEDKTSYSTDDELQRYVHEFIHGRQFMELLLPHKLNPIPKRFENTVKSLGILAGVSRRELDAELKTKQILRSLNSDEKELLDYLEQG